MTFPPKGKREAYNPTSAKPTQTRSSSMADEADFLTPQQHFDALISQLDPTTLATYHSLRHARIETSFEGRQFLLYRMGGGQPQELGRVLVEDLEVGDEGLSSKLLCMRTQRELIVGYSPVQLWDYPIFMCLPLHGQLRYGCAADQVGKRGSLAWPMLVRSRSRRGLRESGITYCETTPSFAREFDVPVTA